ncbi:MAG: cell division protein ZapA [Oligoflexia bacterium]|nr:cell division protein ZapA [Oligoflexia bacterium]
MTQKKSVEIVLGDHKLTLKTDQDPARVQQIAALVNDRLERVMEFGQPMSHQILLLVAMMMGEEILTAEEKSKEMKSHIKAKSQALLTQLEREFPVHEQ